jgi:transcription initiation factor TFIIIB Brf1 subunit/transcription initiation factor TFIIB
MCDDINDPFLIADVFQRTLFTLKNNVDDNTRRVIESKIESPVKTTICKHTHIAKDDTGIDVCFDCGHEFSSLDYSKEWRNFGVFDNRSSRDQSRCHKQKSTPKGIRAVFDAHGINIDDALVNMVESKFNKVIEHNQNRLLRGEGREALVVVCLFYAYQDIGEDRTIAYIRDMLGVSQKSMSGATTLYYAAFPEDITRHMTSERLIPWFMSLTGVGVEHYPRIIAISKYLSATSQLIERSNPQSVAAATIYFYLCLFPKIKEELGLTKTKFAEKAKLSDITITKIVKDMGQISAIAAEDWKNMSEGKKGDKRKKTGVKSKV